MNTSVKLVLVLLYFGIPGFWCLSMSRRNAVHRIQALSFTPFLVQPAFADDNVPISASWTAVDGLNSKSKDFVSFDSSAYTAMVNDASRTPFFEKAIIQRLNAAKNGPESQVVLDLGTGPYALFALMAAKNGAGKVYALEADKDAAYAARAAVVRMGYQDIVEVVEGFSTNVNLPEKVDFCIAEIVGSVASEEGAYASILDARRFLKHPADPSSWIPNRIQTYAAPASYSLHNLFLPPAFDWSKLNGEPVRFNCRDQGLQLLSDPVLVEDMNFADIAATGKKDITFTVDSDRIQDNAGAFYTEYLNGKLKKEEATELSKTAAGSFTGVAFWPRLQLNDEITVNSRHFPDGGHQKSHWQTVLPIMSPTPVPVRGGDRIEVRLNFQIPREVTQPSRYNVSGNVIHKI